MEELSLHPTVKPVQMIADAIRDVSGRGEIVLDLFGGSGSTLIAAEKTGRRGYLCELDPIYCDRILARWEAFAKDEAEQLVCGWTPPAFCGRRRNEGRKNAAEKRRALTARPATRSDTASRPRRRGSSRVSPAIRAGGRRARRTSGLRSTSSE
jgi:hypothetical protein